ncbi:hypothetical protein BDA99DRAFT_536665 [Phascolomyces articulosus]|uniref:Uncharacterized protein n=1 Tax=Phascolomyces articulosus TaxID=60185 RepID=A0AAD5PEY3_9FUNG|nr:hypothetical protein BDA99DRAFT_536665 [Phascolomyces articulosus]
MKQESKQYTYIDLIQRLFDPTRYTYYSHINLSTTNYIKDNPTHELIHQLLGSHQLITSSDLQESKPKKKKNTPASKYHHHEMSRFNLHLKADGPPYLIYQ